MGAEAVMIGSTLLGSGMNYMNQRSANKQMRERDARNQSLMAPFINPGANPADAYLTEFIQNFGSRGAGGGQGFNVGQDALMQLLRSDPRSKSIGAMYDVVDAGGNPFDTSNIFKTLEAVDARRRGTALADLRAGASGLGQRFGSSMMRGEQDLVAQMEESGAARDAQIQQGSYEAAQQRVMQALGMASQGEAGVAGDRINAAQALTQLLTGKAGADQAEATTLLQALGMLSGNASNRQGQTLQALSLMLGQPWQPQQMYNPGGDLGQLGQLLMFMNMMNKPTTGTTTTTTR